MKVFLDSADPEEIAAHASEVDGFTTNPTLFKRAGVTGYLKYAKALCESTDLPVSVEVLSDDPERIVKEARILADVGAVVKIPITTTKGESLMPFVEGLGVRVNVTCCTTIPQVEEAVEAGAEIVSLFAGRIADAGVDPTFIAERAAKKCAGRSELLWASTREVFNFCQAEAAGCDIITVSPDLLRKMGGLGTPLGDVSLESVKQFARDSAGYAL